MDVIEAVIETEAGGAAMAMLRKRPAGGGAWPLVVMFHDGPGIRGATHEFSGKLAAEGFDVVVPDLYHRQGRLLGWERHERATATPGLGGPTTTRKLLSARSRRRSRCSTAP